MAWYICPYIWFNDGEYDIRYCAMSNYTEQLRVDAGRPPQPVDAHGGYPVGESPLWAEAEMLGDRAVVKVHTAASPAMLAILDAEATFYRIPAEVLDIALDDQGVTNPQLNEMWAILEDAGYTASELQDALGIANRGQLRQKLLREYFNQGAHLRWRRPSGQAHGHFEDVDWTGGCPTNIEAIDARIP
jgi:hypothetical protein